VNTPSSLQPIVVPESDDPKVQAFYSQVLEHLSVLHARTGVPTSPEPASPKLPGVFSPNLALMQEIYKDTTMLGASPTPITPATNFGPRSRNHVNPEPKPSGPAIRFPTRPLSLKRKSTQRPKRSTATSNFDSADKENDSPAIAGSGADVKKSSLRKGGKTRKRVQILDPSLVPDKAPSKLKKKRSLRGPSPSSPAPSSTSSFLPSSSPFLSPTSTGWLSNVFKFSRSEAFTLYSIHAVHTTRNECRRLLMAMNVRVVLEDTEGPGVLRCNLQEVRDPNGILSVLKAAKFKVVVRQTEEGVFLLLEHEKGSMDSFREVCKRLRREWVLDAVESQTPEQLALSPLAMATRRMELLSV
ncbi:hypothetical protein BDP27DRAFT_1322383, partial [Rhodocollybia butyracea]